MASSPISPDVATPSGSGPSNFTQSKDLNLCGAEACQSPVFQSAPRPGVKLLCKRHETEERHKNAAAQRRPAVTLERPIQKKKLYSYKPDVDTAPTLKRKRDSFSKSMHSSHSPGDREETLTDRYTQRHGSSHAQIPQNKLAINGKSHYRAQMVTVPDVTSSDRYCPRPIHTENITSSIMNCHNSPRHYSTNGSGTDYAATVPTQDAVILISPSVEESDGPGLQITQELRELVEHKSLDSDDVDVQADPYPRTDQIPPANCPEELEQQIHTQWSDDTNEQAMYMTTEDTNVSYREEGRAQGTMNTATAGNIDTEYKELEFHSGRLPCRVESPPQMYTQILRQQEKSQHKAFTETQEFRPLNNSSTTGSTALDLPQEVPPAFFPTSLSQDMPGKTPLVASLTLPLSPSTTSNEMFFEDEVWNQAPVKESLEAKRLRMASTYDCSRLDSYLGTVDHSSYRELKEQDWGHIDPRTDWPPDFSETEEVEKEEEEICLDVPSVPRAKSKRKANFGKLLTHQVVLHRKQKDRGIQQSKDVTDDKLAEGAALLEQLFGIKDIDELEPGMLNGKFGMKRRIAAADEKRKRTDLFYPLDFS